MNFYDVLISFIIMPLMVLLGVYLSHKLKFIHIFGLHKVISFLKNSSKGNSKQHISSIAALSAILGGNLGTGNISGVAVALTTGGPGSLFWMSVIIFFTSAIKYVNCFLGIKYRIKNKEGEYSGGPMYYMPSSKLAALFAISLIISALTVGNLVQVNSITLPIINSGFPPVFFGFAIALIILFVTVGGMRWFADIITMIVPFMAIVYISSCGYILLTHYNSLIPAFSLIFNSAFSFHNVSGGILGYGVLQMLTGIKVGFARGIFATDIGLGLEAIVHSNVQNTKDDNEKFAQEQSAISALSPFIIMVVCIITGLVLIVTGVWNNTSLESTNMCFAAFNIGIPYSHFAGYITLVVLFCFAFTTILTWMFCGNKAVEFLAPNNRNVIFAWKTFFILLIPIGSVLKSSMLWDVADVAISLMLLLNLYALFHLSGEIVNKKKELLLN